MWNSNQQFVIAGSADAIEKARIWGMSRHVRVKPLTVTHAFHSPQMNPAAADIETVAKTVNYCAPTLPWYSTLSGKLQPNRRIDADYWVEHLIKAVQFKPALDALVQDLSSDAGLVGVEMGLRLCFPCCVETATPTPNSSQPPWKTARTLTLSAKA